MNTEDKIGQLRALLARVRSRARPLNGASTAEFPPVQAAPVHLETASASAPLEGASLPLAPAIEPAPPKHAGRPEFSAPLFVTELPRAHGADSPATTALGRTLNEVLAQRQTAARSPEPAWPPQTFDDVPPMEVVELEVDPYSSERTLPAASAAPPLPPSSEGAFVASDERLESRSRLVSAPPASHATYSGLGGLGRLDIEVDDFAPPPTSDPTLRAALPPSRGAPPEFGVLEDSAPSSSRRPISMEEKMNEAEDEGFHPPPPESGRLPAAAPSFELTFDSPRLPVTPPSEPTRPEGPSPMHAIARAEIGPDPDAVSAEVEVAAFVGEPRAPGTPKTFGELLDDALSL